MTFSPLFSLNSKGLPGAVVSALRSVLGSRESGLHEPHFIGNEINYLNECIRSGYVSSIGPFVSKFESDLASYTGINHAVAVVNGTAALHVALILSGVKPNDEVLVPALTFVATANAVHYCNAIPHFVDSAVDTLGIDPISLRNYLSTFCEIRGAECINKITGRVIRVIVPMHTFGHPVNMEELCLVAEEFCITVVEDAAEALGSTFMDRHAGSFGLISTLSFNGNKTITTGGGGAILTNDPEIAERARHLTTTAKLPHRWTFEHNELGYNYRMPNLNAALGVAQLEKIPEILSAKRLLFNRYLKAFSRVRGVSLFVEPEHCRSNYWLQVLLLDDTHLSERLAVIEATNNEGYGTRPCWNLLPTMPHLAGGPCAPLPVAQQLVSRIINLPSSPFLV